MIHFIGEGEHSRVCREAIQHGKLHHPRDAVLWFVAVGDNLARKSEALAQGGPWATIIHRRAWVSPSASIGEGTVLMAGAIVQPRARIGRHCIINTGATVDHDCVLKDYVHIAPGAHLCGNVHVGEGALVGVGVGIEPGVVIPKWSVVKRIPYVIEYVIEPVSGHATA